MPFTKVTAAGIESSANFIAQNLSVTGVITASNGIQGIGIQSGRLNVTTGIITALNFIGAGNTIVYNSSTKTVDISIGSGNWAFLDELNTNTSNIYRLNGNVGIGTTNASSTFTVRGNSLITGVSTFQGISTFQSNVNIAGTVAIGTAINIIPYNNLNSGTLSFEGSAGQLFSITNNLTSGSIFSVNDVSGIPSIDVDAAGVVELVPFNGTVGIATTNPSSAYKLDVAGNTRFSRDVTISGNVGIATTNPLGPLQIGSAVGSASTQTFVVSGIGSVGIGTTAPFSALDVYGTVYTNRVSIGNSARLSSGLSGAVQRNNQLYIWDQTDANTTVHYPIVIERNTPALDNVKSLIQFSTQNNGGFYSQAYFGVLSTPASDGDLGRGATFIWEHRNTGETMRLTRAGNLGIGSTQPTAKLDVNGGIVVSAGTTSAPAITPRGDSNTGIFFPSDDTIAFSEGGVEAARFDSSGRLFIGTKTQSYSSSEKLEVNGGYAAFINPSSTVAPIYAYNTDTTASTNQPYITLSDASGNRGAIGVNYSDTALWIHGQSGIRFRGSGTSPGTTEWARFDGSGNLGIGTNAPSQKLDVRGTFNIGGGSEGIRLGNVGDNIAYDNVKLYYTGYNSGNPYVYLTPRTQPGSGNVNTYLYLQSNFTGGPGANTMGLLVDGSVAIGTASPATKLDVVQGTGGTDTAKLQNSSSNNVVRLQAASTFDNYIDFYSGASSGTLIFRRGGTETARFNSTGAFVLAGGTTTANGIGIAFPATQSASTDANTLDDYEEGTFTPTITGSTTAGTASYTRQLGYYTKVGNCVNFWADVIYSSGTGTGLLQISGLPFTSSSANMLKMVSIYPNDIALTANNVATASISVSVTSVLVGQYPVGGGTATSVSYDAAGQITVSGSYFV